jgi:hypothetical protein
MAEYIDRDDAIRKTLDACLMISNRLVGRGLPASDGIDVVDIMESIPTADVVPVIRCKDCRFKTLTEDGEYNPHDIVCEIHMSDGFDENDYCSYGERKCDNG